jgi:hypothetical protein
MSFSDNGLIEHKCPETGFPALCYHKACEQRPCPESQAQHFRFQRQFLNAAAFETWKYEHDKRLPFVSRRKMRQLQARENDRH